MAKRKLESSACAACRVQRKKCSEQCVLAPHFPSDDPDKFATVQRVFGTSNIVKMIQGVEAEQRRDAVNSIVYEATARLKDPVHGCARAVEQMKKQIAELETQLAAAPEELMNMRWQYHNLVFLLSTGSVGVDPTDTAPQPLEKLRFEEGDPLMLLDQLWEV